MPSSSCRKWRHPGYGCPTSWGITVWTRCFCLLELYDNHCCWILSFCFFMFFFSYVCLEFQKRQDRAAVPFHFQVPLRIWTATRNCFAIPNWSGWCMLLVSNIIVIFPATQLTITSKAQNYDLKWSVHHVSLIGVLEPWNGLWLSRNSWEWNVIIPTDELTPSFFRGLGGSTTKQLCSIYNPII